MPEDRQRHQPGANRLCMSRCVFSLDTSTIFGPSLTEIHGQPECQLPLRIPSREIVGDSRQHSCLCSSEQESHCASRTQVSNKRHCDRKNTKDDGVEWNRSTRSEPVRKYQCQDKETRSLTCCRCLPFGEHTRGKFECDLEYSRGR